MVLSGKLTKLSQQFIVAKTSQENISLANLTEEEKAVVDKLKWFSLDDLLNSEEVIYPVGLAEYLAPILSGDYPSHPIWIDLAKKPSKK